MQKEKQNDRQFTANVNQMKLRYLPEYCGEFSTVMNNAKAHEIETQPPIPIVHEGDSLIVIGDEQRFLAAKAQGETSLPCIEVEDERFFVRQRLATMLGPNENPMDVAERLKLYQTEYGLTQRELGKEFGVTQATISLYLSLADKIYPEIKKLYADYLKVCDGSRNSQGHPSNRMGAADIGLRHLLEVARLHHSITKHSEKDAKKNQRLFLNQMTTKKTSARQAKIRRKKMAKRPGRADSQIQSIPGVEVYFGDCRHALSELSEGEVDCVITSPPYAANKEYEKERPTFIEHLDNIIPGLQVAARLLKPGGWMFVNFIDLPWGIGDYFPFRDDLVFSLLECEMEWKAPSVWIKPWSQRLNLGNERRLHTEYDMIQNIEQFLAFRKKGRRDIDPALSDAAQEEIRNDAEINEWKMLRCDLNFTHTGAYGDSGEVGNAVFSRSLVDFLIRMFSFPGDTVYDPFAGNATALRVAEKLGRKGKGFERSEKQCLHLGHIVSKTQVQKIEPVLPMGWRRIVQAKQQEMKNLGLDNMRAMEKSRMTA